MTFEEAATKFRGCADYAEWPKNKADSTIAFVRALDSVSDVGALSQLVSAEKG